MAESSDRTLLPELWLVSEDGDVKCLLPLEAVEAYLPSMKALIDAQLSSADSGNLKLLILLDGVSGSLLAKIVRYLEFTFGKPSAFDEEARKLWRKAFVSSLSNEMLTMLKDEVEKRKVTGEVMLLLEKALQTDFYERNSHWKAKLAKKYVTP